MAARTQVHTKVTRQDWIDGALAALADVPIDQLKILNLAATLEVSRSSFYWYFANLDELHRELLEVWERNTRSIVERAERPADTIVGACLGLFECWADGRLYDAALDLAIRDWGRRSDDIAARVSDADRLREQAVIDMFVRHGYVRDEAIVRARLVYHSQVGYYAVGIDESIETRLGYLPHYLEAMAGTTADETELAAFAEVLAAVPPVSAAVPAVD